MKLISLSVHIPARNRRRQQLSASEPKTVLLTFHGASKFTRVNWTAIAGYKDLNMPNRVQCRVAQAGGPGFERF
jgi:hypothetical protein